MDGISLTVNRVKGQIFELCLIPHTQKLTALTGKKVGDRVNLEVDILAKYLRQMVKTVGAGFKPARTTPYQRIMPNSQINLEELETLAKAKKNVEAALEDFRAGKMVILVDDEDRENEGDLTLAAEKVTPELINFMAKFGRGLICLALTEEKLEELDLP